MKTVLSIAGSDSSGGAGVQADIKTIAAHRLFAQTAITALTAQNTLGVRGVLDIPPEFVVAQIDAVFDDMRPDAVKIGMIGSGSVAHAVADALERVGAERVVVDPVMVATAGSVLAGGDAVDAIVARLFPIASIVTPNIPEAEVLSGMEIGDEESLAHAAAVIARLTPGAVLIKGGHMLAGADDLLLMPDGRERWLRHARIATTNTHGTGCSLSSAIACGFACDLDVHESVAAAKEYLVGALSHDPSMGRGNGPLDHMWAYR